MPKVIAMQAPRGALAKYLAEHGYKVVDLQTAYSPGVQIDAILRTGYHPDIFTSHSSLSEAADISLGSIRNDHSSHPVPVNINITGMGPEEVLQLLQHRLHSGCHSHI